MSEVWFHFKQLNFYGVCILMVATSGLLWLPVTLLPVAAAFGYQYKALAVQGILQLCETPVLFCMCPSVLLYQADSKHFLSFHWVSSSSVWLFDGNC